MHFKIDAEYHQGLRVMPEIPSFGVCRLEGHNGVGKSTGIKLLELCTGGQPFAREPLAWQTFKSQLSTARIVVTELQGAEQIEWELDTERWPSKPVPLADLVGRMSIDGKSARMHDVRQLLRVHRFLGHETLTELLAEQVSKAGVAIGQWISSEKGGAGWTRRLILDDHLANIQDLLPNFDTPALHIQERRVKAANEKASALNGLIDRLNQRFTQLREAVQLAEQLDDVRGQGPGLEEQLTRLTAESEKLAAEQIKLDADIADMARQEYRDERARTAFSKSQKLLAQRQRQYTEAMTRFRRLALELKIDADSEVVNSDIVASTRLLKTLQSRVPKVNSALVLRDLITSLAALLSQAEIVGLGDEILINASSGQSAWSVHQLQTALARRAIELASSVPSTDAEKLDTSIAAMEVRLAALAELKRSCDSVEIAEGRLTTAQDRVRETQAELPADVAAAMQDLINKKGEQERRIGELQARIAQVGQTLSLLGDGMNAQTILQKLTTICRTLEVEQSRIRPELQAAERELKQALENAPAVRAEAQSAESALSDQKRKTLVAAQQLQTVSWLPHNIKARLANQSTSTEARLDLLNQIGVSLDRTRDRLDKFTSQVQAIVDGLESMTEQFRTNTVADGPWALTIRAWLQREADHWFNHPEVSDALFDSSDNVQLRLATMDVAWNHGGEPRLRPLHAFSSGQQALAYTRARLATLERDDRSSANRLIALDEFGAFIAADGMDSLTKYLRERHQRVPQDQLVLILPLTEGHMVDISRSGDPANYMRTQLRERGYFAQDLT